MLPQSEISNLKSKILVVVGPTSSGKSELAVRLAKKFGGEIISCDSRQIYRGMDIGTGKVEGKWTVRKIHDRTKCERYVYKGVIHHCIDYANPKKQYSAAQFQRDADKAIREIIAGGKLPILCGGTGHWIDAVVFGQQFPEVKPDKKLRLELEKETADELYHRLRRLDPARAKDIDRFNKRRLIRALEIVTLTGEPVPKISNLSSKTFEPLWLGISQPQDILHAKIKKRLLQRLKVGMIREIKALHKQGLSWPKLESFGLEYKFVSLFLQEKISYDEMINLLYLAITHYAKRQMTWWKRNPDIQWIKDFSQSCEVIARQKFILNNKKIKK